MKGQKPISTISTCVWVDLHIKDNYAKPGPIEFRRERDRTGSNQNSIDISR